MTNLIDLYLFHHAYFFGATTVISVKLTSQKYTKVQFENLVNSSLATRGGQKVLSPNILN